MRHFLRLCGLACVSMSLACAPANQSSPAGEGADAVPGLMSRDLVDYLARLPGIDIRGAGARAAIHVSGSDYPNAPLFVIDGVQYGYDFSSIYSRVQVSDIASVRVIRANHTDAARYGMRGGNGVIEFTMKRGQ